MGNGDSNIIDADKGIDLKKKDFNPDLNIEDYNYGLPDKRIAQYPVEKRDNSRLLVYNGSALSSDRFNNITEYISEGSLLVFNNTRVIRARLHFRKKSGATIEILCLEPLSPSVYELSFRSKEPVEWKCIVGNLKKWKSGIIKLKFDFSGSTCNLFAEKIREEGEVWRIRFKWNKNQISFGEVIEAAGHIPLPPYIKRDDEEADVLSYQTVYSRINGSIAAPTAGLHFTREVINNISKSGIKLTELTLHVGAGTFQPVRSKRIHDHEMHSEHFFITRNTIELLVENYGKIIAVGTTSVRTLESLYWMGVQLIEKKICPDDEFSIGQWEPYQNECKIPVITSLTALIDFMKERKLNILNASTRILIIPGYDFRMIQGLITNFHQPKSTLLLLISALVGNDWKKIYEYALNNNFRFLSYGDSSLLFRPVKKY
jgi:S-adenosylmethionine:tRNA ribosyltransferase-isomerase